MRRFLGLKEGPQESPAKWKQPGFHFLFARAHGTPRACLRHSPLVFSAPVKWPPLWPGALFGPDCSPPETLSPVTPARLPVLRSDRKSTRLNSSHANISYAV